MLLASRFSLVHVVVALSSHYLPTLSPPLIRYPPYCPEPYTRTRVHAYLELKLREGSLNNDYHSINND